MNRLLLAETKRFWARRITRFFPDPRRVDLRRHRDRLLRDPSNGSDFDFVRDIARSEGPTGRSQSSDR
ncbi:MAG: hypothetical protein R2706_20250 [Acidimicrobiales bacterium]